AMVSVVHTFQLNNLVIPESGFLVYEKILNKRNRDYAKELRTFQEPQCLQNPS
ncbi:hypothetical protein PanWU01x14_124050, partial [Parasponia andersonii]